MKDLYRSKAKMYISKAMRSELNFLLHVFNNPEKYTWKTPIAHLIPHDPSFESFGDSCLFACGGFSLDLAYWWYIEWPEEIREKTLKYYIIKKRDPSTGELISINLLEFAVIVVNYLISSLCLNDNPDITTDPYPSLINHADNTTAVSWTRKGATSNEAGKALCKILCAARINNRLGLTAQFLPGEKNIIADRISRVHPVSGNAPNFKKIIQEFPELANCRRFHPSKELLSCLFSALLKGQVTVEKLPSNLGHWTAGNDTLFYS